eukprot:4932191-Prymnesium_polylepis.1
MLRWTRGRATKMWAEVVESACRECTAEKRTRAERCLGHAKEPAAMCVGELATPCCALPWVSCVVQGGCPLPC